MPRNPEAGSDPQPEGSPDPLINVDFKEGERDPSQKVADAVSKVEGKGSGKWKKAGTAIGLITGVAAWAVVTAGAMLLKSVEFAAKSAEGFLKNPESPSKWFSESVKVFKSDKKDKK